MSSLPTSSRRTRRETNLFEHEVEIKLLPDKLPYPFDLLGAVYLLMPDGGFHHFHGGHGVVLDHDDGHPDLLRLSKHERARPVVAGEDKTLRGRLQRGELDVGAVPARYHDLVRLLPEKTQGLVLAHGPDHHGLYQLLAIVPGADYLAAQTGGEVVHADGAQHPVGRNRAYDLYTMLREKTRQLIPGERQAALRHPVDDDAEELIPEVIARRHDPVHREAVSYTHLTLPTIYSV